MKEHFQDYGVRKWAGEDLIDLQAEGLAALQGMVEPYAPCVVNGCEVTALADGSYAVAAGLVALKGQDVKGVDCVKIVRFDGLESTVLPIYLTLSCETLSRVYSDNKSKPIAYYYKADVTTIRPGDDVSCIEITTAGALRLIDTMGITQKLDSVGGEAKDTVVGFVQATERTALVSGTRLGVLLGLVKKWFADLKALAFKDKVAKADLDTALTAEFDNKVDKIAGKGLSANDFTTALKDKLNGVETGANKYSHPTGAGNNHIPSGGSSGQYLKYSSSGVARWNTPTPSEIGAVSKSGDNMTGDLSFDVSSSSSASRLSVAIINAEHSALNAERNSAASKYHSIEMGLTSRDYMNFNEFGGEFNFYKTAFANSDGSGCLLLTKIQPQGIVVNAADGSYNEGLRINSDNSWATISMGNAKNTFSGSGSNAVIIARPANADYCVIAGNGYETSDSYRVRISKYGELYEKGARVYSANNKPSAADIGAASSSHSHSWYNITDKPSTFTPSAHSHSPSDCGMPGIIMGYISSSSSGDSVFSKEGTGIYKKYGQNCVVVVTPIGDTSARTYSIGSYVYINCVGSFRYIVFNF